MLEVNVWAGRPGGATPLHYDGVHNAYVQVAGRKHFVLFLPEAWPHLHLFPKIHPSSRQSQVGETLAPLPCGRSSGAGASPASSNATAARRTASRAASCPGVRLPHKALALAQAVALEAGDLLYLPPYWFHHARRHGLGQRGVAVCQRSHGQRGHGHSGGTATGGWAAPMWGGLTHSQRAAVLRAYLDLVVSDLANIEDDDGSGGREAGAGSSAGAGGANGGSGVAPSPSLERRAPWTAASFAGALVDSRYAPLRHDDGAGAAGLVPVLEAHAARFGVTTSDPGPLAPHASAAVRARAAALGRWRRSQIRVRQGAWEMQLMDLVEDCACAALGPAGVLPFLRVMSGRTVLAPPAGSSRPGPAQPPAAVAHSLPPIPRRETEVNLLAVLAPDAGSDSTRKVAVMVVTAAAAAAAAVASRGPTATCDGPIVIFRRLGTWLRCTSRCASRRRLGSRPLTRRGRPLPQGLATRAQLLAATATAKAKA